MRTRANRTRIPISAYAHLLSAWEEDVANCRHDITRHLGAAAGDQFVATWLAITGKRDYHPYWDLTNILSKADDQPDPELDEYAAAARI